VYKKAEGMNLNKYSYIDCRVRSEYCYRYW